MNPYLFGTDWRVGDVLGWAGIAAVVWVVLILVVAVLVWFVRACGWMLGLVT